jgi:hypothetical protein
MLEVVRLAGLCRDQLGKRRGAPFQQLAETRLQGRKRLQGGKLAIGFQNLPGQHTGSSRRLRLCPERRVETKENEGHKRREAAIPTDSPRVRDTKVGDARKGPELRQSIGVDLLTERVCARRAQSRGTCFQICRLRTIPGEQMPIPADQDSATSAVLRASAVKRPDSERYGWLAGPFYRRGAEDRGGRRGQAIGFGCGNRAAPGSAAADSAFVLRGEQKTIISRR